MIKNINNQEFLFLICQKVEQPIGTFYISSVPWHILKEVAFTEPRILLGINDDGSEEYTGIQRHISKTRQEEIKNYINGSSATFPSSILLNIPKDELRIEEFNFRESVKFEDRGLNENNAFNPLNESAIELTNNLCVLTVRYQQGVAQIIDGQHRLSGFKDLTDTNFKFDLPVTIFIDQSQYDQAEIFATINGKQTRVTPSLVYDLFGISDVRNPYTVARFIVKSLNESEESPLKQEIKMLGKANDYYSGFVTQSTVSNIIIDLICGNLKQAEEDRRRMQKKEEISDEPELTRKDAPLRRYFKNEKDEVILKVLLNFFNAVKESFHEEWNKEEDSILKRTVGFTALLKILPKLIIKGKENKDLSKDYFLRQFENSQDIDFSEIQLSSKGVKQLVDRFNIDT